MNSILNTNRGKFILGVAVCFAVAALAVLIERLIPIDTLVTLTALVVIGCMGLL